ncbi:hypothetical protein TNCV_2198231 [Trichonephila clavipes]|nr:hypothetical protein TNCV_2198231 [Trichonephila clavipes]
MFLSICDIKNWRGSSFLFDINVIIMIECVPRALASCSTTLRSGESLEKERGRKSKICRATTREFCTKTMPRGTMLSVKQFLADKCITVLKHPPYAPDLTPYDVYLFLKVKNSLMGTHFQSV